MKDISTLNLPLNTLGLSNEFLQMAEKNGFSTLKEMTEITVDELRKLDLFDLRMLREYMNILSQHGLDDLIED